MSNIYIIKEQMMGLYSKWSRWIDMVFRFVIGIIAFSYVNDTIGYMAVLDNIFIVIGMALLAAFFPLSITVLLAAGLILAHLSSFHILFMALTAVLFFLIFVFCFRFTAKGAGILLLTPVSFVLGVPYIMPIAIGLVGSVTGIVPLILGAVVYFFFLFIHDMEGIMDKVEQAKEATAAEFEVHDALVAEVQALTEQGADPALIQETQLSAEAAAVEVQVAQEAQAAAEATLSDLESGGVFTELLEQIALNKELWVAIAMLALGVCIVFGIKKIGMSHSWKIAVASGIAMNFVVVISGSIMFDLAIPMTELLIGNLLALIIGLGLEILFLGVDYNRTEILDFEDDEYVYYVKAVPKVRVAKQQKTVKKINSNNEKPNVSSNKSGAKVKNEEMQQTRVIGKK